MSKRFSPRVYYVLAAALVGLCGTILILVTQASTPTVSIEAENGNAANGAVSLNDSSASGGSAIQFAPAHNLLVPTSGALLGVSSSATTASGIGGLEADMNRRFDVDVNFWSFPTSGTASNISAATLADDAANGRVPMVTWQPQLSGSSADIMPDITAGVYDTYLQNVAQQLRAYGKPVLLRFAHEMNGNWYSWSGCQNGCGPAGAAAYVEAWRHVYTVFKQASASNVLWVWCTSASDVPSGVSGHHWTDYYPGDSYVDWVSYDHYISPGKYTATGTSGALKTSDVTATWQSSQATRLLDDMRQSGATMYSDYNLVNGTRSRKPIFIAETMNGPDLDDAINQLILNGQLDVSSYDKTQFFGNIISDLQAFPGIKGVAFFDHYTNGSGNAHDYCLNEQDCHPQKWNGNTLPTPNAGSSPANYNAFLAMAKNCYLDSHKRQTACP